MNRTKNEAISFTVDTEFGEVKVMVWYDLSVAVPVCGAEIVPGI